MHLYSVLCMIGSFDAREEACHLQAQKTRLGRVHGWDGIVHFGAIRLMP